MRLHKMSTTAGVGSTDYVAINGAAIAAMSLGLGSLLVFVNATLLFIPLIGVICAIIAIRQISQSNGTQAGTSLAVIGLLLSLGIGGWVGAGELTEGSRTRGDRAAIKVLIEQMGEDVKAGEIDAAYEKTGPGFKEKVTKERFVERMTGARSNPVLGTLLRVESNDLVVFQKEVDGSITAVAAGLFMFDKTNEPFRQTMTYRKTDGSWQLEAMPDLFPATPPGGAPGQPPGDGGPMPGGGGPMGPPSPM